MSRGSWAQVYSGAAFYPLDPLVGDIHIDDIASSLSMQCRYNGHQSHFYGGRRRFYSVAEHCVILSHAVSEQNAQWALMHDAAEAYIGDMIYPLKEEIPQFKVVEAAVMVAVCARFGLGIDQPEEVTEYDRRIVIDEKDAMMAPEQVPWSALEGYLPLGVEVHGWSPDRAKDEFMSRFQQLFT